MVVSAATPVAVYGFGTCTRRRAEKCKRVYAERLDRSGEALCFLWQTSCIILLALDGKMDIENYMDFLTGNLFVFRGTYGE